jgi:hypothetical protein
LYGAKSRKPDLRGKNDCTNEKSVSDGTGKLNK